MSGSLNKVILVGHLGREPEVRVMQSGDKMTNLNVATSDRWTDRDGNRQDRTEWHRVVIFGRTAEIAEKYLHKGSRVLIEGRLQTRKWTDQQSGVDRYTTEVVVSGFGGNLTLMDSRKDESRRGSDYGDDDGGSGGYSDAGGGDSTGGSADDFEDDVPF